jgi:hypothetical protein
MLKQKELDYHLNDSGAKVLVCLESLYESVAKEVLSDTSVEHVFTTSELDFLPVGTVEDLALLWDASRRWFEDVPDCWRRSALQSRPRGCGRRSHRRIRLISFTPLKLLASLKARWRRIRT